MDDSLRRRLHRRHRLLCRINSGPSWWSGGSFCRPRRLTGRGLRSAIPTASSTSSLWSIFSSPRIPSAEWVFRFLWSAGYWFKIVIVRLVPAHGVGVAVIGFFPKVVFEPTHRGRFSVYPGPRVSVPSYTLEGTTLAPLPLWTRSVHRVDLNINWALIGLRTE